MKEVTMTEFSNMKFIKVAHELNGFIVGLDVLQMKDGMVTQISPGILTPEEDGKLLSGVHDRLPTEEEIQLVDEILSKRAEYALNKTVQYVEAVGGTTLLYLGEIGGRYFAYTTHDTLHFNRLSEIILPPENLPADIGEVPKDLLPAVVEQLPAHMLPDKNKGMTMQIGDGVFLRLRRQSSTMFATIVLLETEEGVIKRISAPLGFAMGLKRDGWEVIMENPDFTSKVHEEMQKALDHVTNELTLMQKERS